MSRSDTRKLHCKLLRLMNGEVALIINKHRQSAEDLNSFPSHRPIEISNIRYESSALVLIS